jgi:hypothetical protein
MVPEVPVKVVAFIVVAVTSVAVKACRFVVPSTVNVLVTVDEAARNPP